MIGGVENKLRICLTVVSPYGMMEEIKSGVIFLRGKATL